MSNFAEILQVIKNNYLKLVIKLLTKVTFICIIVYNNTKQVNYWGRQNYDRIKSKIKPFRPRPLQILAPGRF